MRFPALVTAAALVLIAAGALWYANRVPAVVPASAPPAAFSAERALRHVREIAQRPHPAGSVDQARVLQYITTQTAALGIATSVQATTGVGTRYPVAGQVRNILARLPGSQPGGPAVLLMAHYDGVPAAPAAGDDASGSAVLLETLRALRSGSPLTHDVIALFTDAEEAGLLGAAAFVREHPWAKDVAVVLNFEARGTHGPSLMFETGAGNADVVSVLRDIGGARATSLSTAVYRALPNDTDLSELMALGKPAMNFAFIGGVERYHTAEDDVAHLSPGSVQHHGNQALALARAFANGPLPRPQTADAVFFDFPLLGVVTYPEWIAVAAAIVTLILVILGMVQLRRAGMPVFRDAALGALAFILSLLVAGGAAFGLASLLAAVHANVGGAPQWRGIYAAASAFLVAAIVLATYALARRAASAQGLGLGALFLIAVVALFAAVAAPGVSFLLGWPAFFAASAAVGGAVMGRGTIAVAKGWVAAVVTLFLMVPTIYLMVCVALGLDGIGSVALATLTAISLWLLSPHVEVMTATTRWRPAAFAGTIAILLALTGMLTVRTTPQRPAGVALVYAVDADSQTAWFAGGGTTPGVRNWIAGATAALPPQQAPAQPPRWLTRMYPASRIGQVPLTPTSAPSAVVVGDSMAGNQRVVTLRVRGGAGARSVQLSAPAGSIASMKVDGREVDRSRYRSRPAAMSLEYTSPPDTGFTVELTLPTSTSAELAIMARHSREGTPPEVALPGPPEGIIPIQSGNATIVYRTVQLPPVASLRSR